MTHYVVTLKKGTDIDAFYDDMETSGGTTNVPDREVTCVDRRPISRNTGYDLEDDEVTTLLNDDRVIDIQKRSDLDDVTIKPTWQQEADQATRWSKASGLNADDHNWGLKRCIDGVQTPNWGSDGTSTLSGIVSTTSGGRNVDVLIVDGFIDPTHPEFAYNSDGTGGTRVRQFNWLSLTPQVTGGAAGDYVYDAPANNNNQNHGMHVAGTCAGNSQGWARYSNIYNVSPYDNQLGGFLFDFIRVWHTTKPINPETGRRNPTVVNNSWGSSWNGTARANIQSITFQGTQSTATPFSDADLQARGIVDFDDDDIDVMAFQAATVADMEDCVDAGIVFVAASGNDSTFIDVEGGTNWDNVINFSGTDRNYHRGSSNGSASVTGVGGSALTLCVGNISRFTTDQKSGSSNPGPRVEVYAPGTAIISPTNGNQVTGGVVSTAADPRNASYSNFKISGTSMASPQVAGMVACLLEQYPRMNQYDVNAYIAENMPLDQIIATSGGFTDNTSLQGGPNRYMKYVFERPENGVEYPLVASNSRKTTNGVKYPRPRVMVDRTTANVNNNNNLVLTLTSSSFTDGGVIPTDHKNSGGCGGSNNSPQISLLVTGSHSQVDSLRLECWDIDGGNGNSRDGYFRHWAAWNISVNSFSLAENADWAGTVQVQTSDFGGGDRSNGWGGPCPPSGTHQYRIQIYPVDSEGNEITSDVRLNTLTFTSS